MQLSTIPEPGVVFMALSPAGGYLVTCQKPSKTEGEKNKNLKVCENALFISHAFSLRLVSVSPHQQQPHLAFLFQQAAYHPCPPQWPPFAPSAMDI